MQKNLKRTLVDVALNQFKPMVEKARPDEVLPVQLWVITQEQRLFFFSLVLPPQRDYFLAVLRRAVQGMGATHAALVSDALMTIETPATDSHPARQETVDVIQIGGAVRDTGATFGLTLPYRRKDGGVMYEPATEGGIDSDGSSLTGRMTLWFVPPDVSQWPPAAVESLERDVQKAIGDLTASMHKPVLH